MSGINWSTITGDLQAQFKFQQQILTEGQKNLTATTGTNNALDQQASGVNNNLFNLLTTSAASTAGLDPNNPALTSFFTQVKNALQQAYAQSTVQVFANGQWQTVYPYLYLGGGGLFGGNGSYTGQPMNLALYLSGTAMNSSQIKFYSTSGTPPGSEPLAPFGEGNGGLVDWQAMRASGQMRVVFQPNAFNDLLDLFHLPRNS